MTTTQNLHLPQWEDTDRIMRTDFNAAFAALDAGVKANADAITTLGTTKANAASVTAALAQKADASALTALDTRVGALETDVATRSRFVKLKEIALTENAQSVTMDVSDIDWSQWQRVHLDINVGNYQQAVLDGIRADGTACIIDYIPGAALSKPSLRRTLNPGCMAGRTVERFTTANSASYKPTTTFQELASFALSDTTFSAGGKMILWGEQ